MKKRIRKKLFKKWVKAVKLENDFRILMDKAVSNTVQLFKDRTYPIEILTKNISVNYPMVGGIGIDNSSLKWK